MFSGFLAWANGARISVSELPLFWQYLAERMAFDFEEKIMGTNCDVWRLKKYFMHLIVTIFNLFVTYIFHEF